MHSPITNRWGEVPARPLQVEELTIFRGSSDWSYNHHPQLAVHAGTLLATWSSGKQNENEAGQRMVVSRSADQGRTWSEPETVAPSRPGRHCPSVVVSSGIYVHGEILTAYYGEWERWHGERDAAKEAEMREQGRHPSFNVRTEVRHSADGGRNWSDPLAAIVGIAGFMPPMPTTSGRLIFSGHLTYAYTDDPQGVSGWTRRGLPGLAADYVDDWDNHPQGATIAGLTSRFSEANFFQTDDGVIHMMLRNEEQSLLGVTESQDDGESWSYPQVTSFTNSVSRSHFGRLRDGRFFCVNCPRLPPDGRKPSTRTPRTPMVLALSENGVHFDRHFIVGDAPQGEARIPASLKHGRYGYPYLQVTDRFGFVIFSKNKEDICVARFSLPDIDK